MFLIQNILTMNKQPVLLHYQIAGHPFDLEISSDIFEMTIQEAYAPFQAEPAGVPPLFTLTVVEDDTSFPPIVGTVSSFEKGYGNITMYFTSIRGIIIHLSLPGLPPCCYAYADLNANKVLVCLRGSTKEISYGLDNTIMLAYAFHTIKLDTLLINASVVECKGNGYLFPGRNGMNHTRRMHCLLWKQHVEGAFLLNNDTTVVRIMGGKPFLFSTPWNERDMCRSDTSVPLKAIIQLAQAQHRQVRLVSAPGIYATLLSACWSLKWNDSMIGMMHDTLHKLAANIPTYRLECTSDTEDVGICAHILGIITKD